MCESDFHIISRFRNDVILYYPTLEKKTGKRGHPKWFDGRIDFAKLDLTRCKEYEVNKGKLYGFSLQCIACCCQLGQSGMQEARNSLFHILLQVIHTQCLYA